jgi:hypothetical protein
VAQDPEGMSSPTPLVAVIILNWNGLADTLECLQSLRHSDYRRLRIIIWDNGSREDPAAALADYPEVMLLRSADNLGFAAGCTRAAARALDEGADYLLFLNNDTHVPPEMIARMVAAHGATPRAGLIGVPEVVPDRPEAPRRLGATWLPLSCRVKWRRAPAHAALPDPLPLDVISGAALLVSREVARQVGLFDEAFFAYWEDVDLSLRVKQAGYTNLCATSTHVVHKCGRSTGAVAGFSRTQMYLLCRGQALMARKHARGLGRLTAPLWLLASGILAGLIGFARPRRRKLMRAKLAALTDGWQGKPVDRFWLP